MFWFWAVIYCWWLPPTYQGLCLTVDQAKCQNQNRNVHHRLDTFFPAQFIVPQFSLLKSKCNPNVIYIISASHNHFKFLQRVYYDWLGYIIHCTGEKYFNQKYVLWTKRERSRIRNRNESLIRSVIHETEYFIRLIMFSLYFLLIDLIMK